MTPGRLPSTSDPSAHVLLEGWWWWWGRYVRERTARRLPPDHSALSLHLHWQRGLSAQGVQEKARGMWSVRGYAAGTTESTTER